MPSLGFTKGRAPRDPAFRRELDAELARIEAFLGLAKVDSDKKTLSVKAADGAETTFTYTSSTVISGDQKSEQGLATAEGSMVTVHYSVKDGSKVASKIEVQPRAQQ